MHFMLNILLSIYNLLRLLLYLHIKFDLIIIITKILLFYSIKAN